MVGVEKIREYLGDFNANYIIIGGTACNLNLEDADLQGRATKDIDMIVVCEAINTEYIRQFRTFIHAGGYKACQINSKDETKRGYYRFIEPADNTFPAYIELFSRTPDELQMPKNVRLVHINSDEEYLSGFSAILMDDDFYYYAIANSREIKGVQVLDKNALVVLKARAYLNNKKRKEEGQQVHQSDIDKHKKDIYRLSFLFSGEERYAVTDAIRATLEEFLEKIQTDFINTKAIAKSMGTAEVTLQDFVQKIKNMFQIN
ncbi:MAG: hypothetical protein FWH18_12060 [Marinilabiliaceae bacterium]|nr:hypothetical protein [Marinilabiliaceae bacterium]